MSGTTSVPFPTLGPAGFILPAEADILTGVQADMNAALGGDVNPALETPQGQWASSLTAMLGDQNDQFLAVTMGVDPQFADGRMQDGIARIYFIERKPALATVVQATCTGVVNTVIPAGVLAQAVDGNIFIASSAGTIGADGTVIIPFACTTTGPIECPAGSLKNIYRGVSNWDSISNVLDGVVGTDQEPRAVFEQRRQQQVAKNSNGSIPSVQGSVLSVPGLIDAYTTDNSTFTDVIQDGVTIPAGSLYVCVAGGDPQAVATAIWQKKMPGCPMAGNTTITVQDTNTGYSPPYPSYNITFQTAAPQTFVFAVTITNSPLVPSTATSQIQAAILNAFAGLDGGPRARIGSSVYASRFYSSIASLGIWAQIVSVLVGSTNAPAATFAASISGTVMTVTAVSQGSLLIGQLVVGAAAGTTISSNGTGTGGTGTYNLSLSQNVGSQQMQSIVATLDVGVVGVAHIPALDTNSIIVNYV